MSESENQLPPRLQEIVEDFNFIEGREKLEYLLEFAQQLPPLPERLQARRDEMDEVHECMTPVFIFAEMNDGHLDYFFDIPPEGPTVRGYAEIMRQGLKGCAPREVLAVPNEFYLDMGLQRVLTGQRLNGISAIVAHMKELARPHLSPDEGEGVMAQRPVSIYAILIFGVFSIGASGIFVRWADAPGVVTGFYRMAVTTVVLAPPFLLRRRRASKPLPRRPLLLALLGGLLFAGDLTFWNSGIMLSGATTPTVLANMSPLWVGLGAQFIFRERLPLAFWLGLLMAIGGALVVLGLGASASFSVGLGAVYEIVAGMFYAAYFLVAQKSREALDAITFFWPAAVTSTVVLLFLSLQLDYQLTGYSTQTYLSFLALGLLVQVVGQFAISYTLGFLRASLVAPVGLLQPIITAILAFLLLGERLTAVHVAAGTLILAGVLVVQRSRHGEMELREAT